MTRWLNHRLVWILDTLSLAFAWCCFAIVSLAFIWLVGSVISRGLGSLSWGFLLQSPTDAGRAGGIGPIIVSTLLIVLVCVSVSVPIGLGSAIFLAEHTRQGKSAWWVRRSLDLLSGVPSIVFGLFGSAFFCELLGLGASILAGGLTLACMVLPILIRVTGQGLRAVPESYRQAAAAVGLSRTSTLVHIILPRATPALVAGLVLGIARSLAETAALIFTAGYATRMPTSIFDSGRSLSVHIYDMSMNVAGGNDHAFASATVLVLLLVGINSLAFGVVRRFGNANLADTASPVYRRLA